MIDYHKELVSTLNTILPTHYEMVLHSGLDTPCISYMENNNYDTNVGDTLGYSALSYIIKVWANDIGLIQKYSLEIDKKLKPLGWKRISSGELYDNKSTMIQKIMTFEALALEEY
jgi:predicted transcriptional regulator YheO